MSVEFAVDAFPTASLKRACGDDECQRASKKTPWSLPTDFKMPTLAEGFDISPTNNCMTLAAETVGDIDRAMLSDRKETCEKALLG